MPHRPINEADLRPRVGAEQGILVLGGLVVLVRHRYKWNFTLSLEDLNHALLSETPLGVIEEEGLKDSLCVGLSTGILKGRSVPCEGGEDGLVLGYELGGELGAERRGWGNEGRGLDRPEQTDT